MTIIDELTPTAARFACAVAEDDVAESHAILGSLNRESLMAVAVILAASVDLDQPLGASEQNTSAARVARIAVAVADHMEISTGDIYSVSRVRETANARAIVCWLATAAGLKSTYIGRALGRDHSTVLHAVEKVTATPRLLHHAELIKAEMERKG